MKAFLMSKLAEKMGFEPMRGLHPLAVFETAPFDHLGISPAVSISLIARSSHIKFMEPL